MRVGALRLYVSLSFRLLTNMLNWITTHIPPWFWITIVCHLGILGTVAYLILLERKTASWVQDRIGPNRVGLGFGIIPWLKDKHMFGLGQPLADGLKFILKEDYRPKGVDRILFSVAPMIMITVIIVSIAALPWGGIRQGTITFNVNPGQDPTVVANEQTPASSWIVPDGIQQTSTPGTYTATYQWHFGIAYLNIGVLFILAVLSLAVYGVVIGGWASNNKYSFLGGLRATANMISYEVPLGLAVLTIVVMYGTLNLDELVAKQAWMWHGIVPAWNIFTQPLAFFMFLICIHAEANRAPFDLAECEQELVGGYHTEYSAMRFALFFLAEYAGMITTSAVCVALFFGGWHVPYLDKIWPSLAGNVDPMHPEVTTYFLACFVRAVAFFIKTIVIIFIFMWVRWSLPRFRFDQLMGLAWRALIPMALVMLLVTCVVVYAFGEGRNDQLRVGGKMALVLLASNLVMLLIVVVGSFVLPAAPDTNRKIRVPGSRFEQTPVPAA
jgi:NADH-quinone oxidoreductase subunit H